MDNGMDEEEASRFRARVRSQLSRGGTRSSPARPITASPFLFFDRKQACLLLIKHFAHGWKGVSLVKWFLVE
jgi:hypothetical protein